MMLIANCLQKDLVICSGDPILEITFQDKVLIIIVTLHKPPPGKGFILCNRR